MNLNISAREYVQRLKANISRCASIVPDDRVTVPSRFDEDRRTWIIVRGFDAPQELFAIDPVVSHPFELIEGGCVKVEVRVREVRRNGLRVAEVASYQLTFLEIPENRNNIQCLRYDQPAGQPRGAGWDEDLQDNPCHPRAHLHVNFLPPGDNNCRMPTGPICPILLLRAFDHWYYTTFRS